MDTKQLIKKYEAEIKKARSSGGDIKHFLEMIEAGKRVQKLPPLIDDIEEQRQELYARTDKLLEKYNNMIEFYGTTTTN